MRNILLQLLLHKQVAILRRSASEPNEESSRLQVAVRLDMESGSKLGDRYRSIVLSVR
jgi:hypothetical protein